MSVKFLLFTISTVILSGCITSRSLITTGAGTVGAVAGNVFSKGDPLATAGGAAAGIALSEGLHYASEKARDRVAKAAYDKGRSDSTKETYWILQNRARLNSVDFQTKSALVNVPGPVRVNGVNLVPNEHLIRVVR